MLRTDVFFKKTTMLNMKVFSVSLLCLLVITGCAPRQRAVALYVDAVELMDKNDPQLAVVKLNTAVKIDSDFSLAHSLLGQVYQQLADYENSAASYQRATRLNPWSFMDFFNLGKVYQIMEKFRDAAIAYANACQLKADHYQAHFNAAECYYKIDDFKNAADYARRAEQIDPNVTELQKLLGDIYESQNDYNQALVYYKRALELDSDNPDIMTSLAIVYLKAARIEPAKELLTQVTQLKPDDSTAYQYLGYCYLQINSQIAQKYKDRQKQNPDDTELLESLKQGAEKALETAIGKYTRAAQINENDWQAYRGLGVAFMVKAIGNDDAELKQKAIEQWQKSLTIKPDQPRKARLLKLIEKYSQ
jgi:tetratricopeptide (TPR) repeat protein